MLQCGLCDFSQTLVVQIKQHLLEEHGVCHLNNFNNAQRVGVDPEPIKVSTRSSKKSKKSSIDQNPIPQHSRKRVSQSAKVGDYLDNEERTGPTVVKKSRGQTTCDNCGDSFNNNGRPDICDCGTSLLKPDSCTLNAFHLYGSVFSVRAHRAGIGKRVIVDKETNMCYAVECQEVRAHYSTTSMFNCIHLNACQSGVIAEKLNVTVENLRQFISCEETLSSVMRASNAGNLEAYLLPNDTIALSSFMAPSHECPSGIIHIDRRKMKCPLRKCSMRPGAHFLVKRVQMCLHVLICKVLTQQHPLQSRNNYSVPADPLFSKCKTAEYVVEKIINVVPSALEPREEEKFLQESFMCQTELLETQNISKFFVTKCDRCENPVEERAKRPGNNLIATPGFIIEVEIVSSICKFCQILHYPHLYQIGFVPISDSLLVSWSVMVDARGQLTSGNKIYSYFFNLLKRLVSENKELSTGIGLK